MKYKIKLRKYNLKSYHFTNEHYLLSTLSSIYLHFVDFIWLVVLVLLYIL